MDDDAAEFRIEDEAGAPKALLAGDWTATTLADASTRLADSLKDREKIALDLRGVGRCDTAGAYAILRAMQAAKSVGEVQASRQLQRLLHLVDQATQAPPSPKVERRPFYELLERLGRGVFHIGAEFYDLMVFIGHLLVAIGRAVRAPHKIRWAAIFTLAERSGLDAIPIVAITAFFIGSVVGLLGANILTDFGAQVFAVDLIGIAVLREFNVLITALLLAGRSSSSFAAEIGAMKMNQEIDAMHVLGIDPFEALVFPRFVALLLMIPLLTFVATLAGLAGGMLVSWLTLDLSPTFFFQRLVDNVSVTHFWIGMSKAPVMAAVVAAIGCRQGMEVGEDVESLGRRVTTAVVQAIFSIILLDAIFAVIYMELNL